MYGFRIENLSRPPRLKERDVIGPSLDRIVSSLGDCWMNTEAESMISRNWLDRIAILILLVQILLLTGCGARTFKAYTGIERSPAEVAIIRPDPAFGILVRIYSVDGNSVTGGSADLGTFPREVVVLPGPRTVHAQVGCCGVVTDYWGRATISFRADAGRSYVISGGERSGKKGIWVIDEQTGAILAETPFSR